MGMTAVDKLRSDRSQNTDGASRVKAQEKTKHYTIEETQQITLNAGTACLEQPAFQHASAIQLAKEGQM